MKIAIYTAGPTLEATMRGGFDLGIAVNRASLIIPPCWYDWLSAGDADIYRELTVPRLGWCSLPPDAERIRQDSRWQAVQSMTWDDFPKLRRINDGPSYSITGAIAMADHFGATAIVVFGHSGAGESDCVGLPGADRTVHRWKREANELQQIAALISAPITYSKDRIMDQRDVTTSHNRMAKAERRGKSPTAQVLATVTSITRVQCGHCGAQFAPRVWRSVPYDDGKQSRQKTRCPTCGTWHWLPPVTP